MNSEEILSKKRVGDIRDVASIIGESPNYTRLLLNRPGAKKHGRAMEALQKVIEARERIINESKTNN